MKNPIYTNLSKFAVWAALLVAIPVRLQRMHESGIFVSDILVLALYVYLLVANFVLGYRLKDPPFWSKYLIPKKWIDDWVFLSENESEFEKSNRIRLFGFIVIIIIATCFLFSYISPMRS
jgi:hypothetical protein